MKMNKRERQIHLQETIKENPFVTDEELAEQFSVSVQTIRLDRLELSIPELRERIKHVAETKFDEAVRSLPIDEVIGEIIDIELDKTGRTLVEVNSYVNKELVFKGEFDMYRTGK